MNNNSQRKGFVRFSVRSGDDQDASLIEHDEEEGETTEERTSRIEHSPLKRTKILKPRHSTRVTINSMTNVALKTNNNCKLKCFVFWSGMTIIVGMILILHFYHKNSDLINIGDGTFGLAQLRLSEKTLTILDHNRITRAKISLAGTQYPTLNFKDSENCGNSVATMSGLCLNWRSLRTKLRINPVTLKKDSYDTAVQCYKVSWTYKPDYPHEDCILLDDVNDHKKLKNQVWIDTQKYKLWPTYPQHPEGESDDSPCSLSCQLYTPGGKHSSTAVPIKNMGGTIIEPLWLSSNAVLLKASLHSPLQACTKLCHNTTKSTLCLQTQLDESHQLQAHLDEEKVSNLTYVACIGHSATELYEEVADSLLKPKSVLPSTDVLYDIVNDGVYLEKSDKATQTRDVRKNSIVDNCLDLLKKPLWNIVFNGDQYNTSVIARELEYLKMIGGTGYLFDVNKIFKNVGDFMFRNETKVKVPDIIKVLHDLKFGVMIPVTPFVNYNSQNFQHAVERRLLISNDDHNAPLLTNVSQLGKNFIAGVIDFTNAFASSWFSENVEKFQRINNIDYLHFIYGQASWLPKHYTLVTPLHNPSFYSTIYTNIANQISPCPVSDVAFSSQADNQFVMLNAMMDLEGTMEAALASGIAGYPFFIPNLPSHLKDGSVLGAKVLEEGFLRWIQLVSFFPVVHIPWDFEVLSEVGLNLTKLVDETKKYLSIRTGPIVWPALESAIHDAELSSTKPIISPIWMAPGVPPIAKSDFDREIYEVNDQFMIGNDLVFAPMLNLGEKQRDVYLPPGQWEELFGNRDIKFPNASDGHWINLSIDLDATLIFVRKK